MDSSNTKEIKDALYDALSTAIAEKRPDDVIAGINAQIDKRVLDCGHKPTPRDGISTGTATLPDEREVCYACADSWQRARMRETGELFAYLSTDGTAIQTWSGGDLITITAKSVRRVGFRDYSSKRPERWYVTRRDADGNVWHGQGPGPGMYCRMKRARRAGGGAS